MTNKWNHCIDLIKVPVKFSILFHYHWIFFYNQLYKKKKTWIVLFNIRFSESCKISQLSFGWIMLLNFGFMWTSFSPHRWCLCQTMTMSRRSLKKAVRNLHLLDILWSVWLPATPITPKTQSWESAVRRQASTGPPSTSAGRLQLPQTPAEHDHPLRQWRITHLTPQSITWSVWF